MITKNQSNEHATRFHTTALTLFAGTMLCTTVACDDSEWTDETEGPVEAETQDDPDEEAVAAELEFRTNYGQRLDVSRILRPYDKGWGNESDFAYCPQGTYASGYGQKVEGFGASDATGGNGIKLICSGSGAGEWMIEPNNTGPWGVWHNTGGGHHPVSDCGASSPADSQYYRGVIVRGGSFPDHDDFGISTVRMICGSQGWHSITYEESFDHSYLEQTGGYCQANSAVCGVKTRVEPSLGGDNPWESGLQNDDTAMNGVEFACCCEPGYEPHPESGVCVTAGQVPETPCGHMRVGEVLNTEERLYSCDGRFHLRQQGDGNLVLYKGTTPLWASNTVGYDTNRTIFQHDGNLITKTQSGHVTWASQTHGNPDSYLRVQDDGNLVIYRRGGGAIWASGTYGH